MYPHDIIFGVGLYEICIIVGLILSMVVFRVCADKRGLSAKLQNVVLLAIPFALFIGYPASVVVQWFYNSVQAGDFSTPIFAATTGSTFYGGLIGGTLAFLAFYLTSGRFVLKDREYLTRLHVVYDLAPCAITVAHAVGRLGCFFAGCCYGLRTDSVIGVSFPGQQFKVIPTQLFEVFFLLVLFAFLMIRYFDGKHHTMTIYLIAYGVWRFLLEYLRGDDRGETVVPFLTPSQLTAILMILLGIVLFLLRHKFYGRPAPKPTADPDGGKTE